MKKTLFLLIVTASLSFADEIYLQTGFVIKNVTARDTVENYLTIVSNNGEKKIVLAQIIKIVRADVDHSKGPIMEQFDEMKVQKNKPSVSSLSDQPIPKYEQPNIGYISISVISALLAYDNFNQLSSINHSLDEIEKFNATAIQSNKMDPAYLESEKTKRLVLGVGFGIISIVNLMYSLEKVEVKSDLKSLSVSYTF